MARRLRDYPAYARTIAALIVRGQKPMAVGVLLSARWHYFNHVPKVCIQPEEWGVGVFEFGYLRDQHVVAVPGDDCTELQLAELVLELMRAGPRLLWVYNVDGSKVYDGDDAWVIAEWVRELALKVAAKDRITLPVIRAAQAIMAAAQLRAAERWNVESTRIAEKGGDEAFTKFYTAGESVKDRVRSLFSSPWQDSGDARAA